MFSSPIADFLTIAKVAWDLYTKGYAVASAAPVEFRQLLKELDSFRRILYYFGEATKDRELDETLLNCLDNCVEALEDFESLVEKFERLATSAKGNWFIRLRWANEQSDIAGCRNKIFEHRSNLSLCLQVDQMNYRGRSPSFVPRDRSTPRSSLSASEDDLIDLEPLARRGSIASSDVSSIRRRFPSDVSTLTHPSLLPLVRGAPVRGTSIYDGGTNEPPGGFEWPRPSWGGLEEDFPFQDIDVVHQPLELNEVRVKHNATEGLVKKFHESREAVKSKCQVDIGIWLGLSVWWLVKARKFYELDDPADRSTKIGRSPLSTPQAYANLLKSSWILEEEVLASAGDGENLSREARKFVRDLTEALDEDLRHVRKPEASIPPEEILLGQDLKFQESLVQHAEEANVLISSRKDDMSSPQRWVTVELRDSGSTHETALYRTFVNAHLGPKGVGHLSRLAPYMLVLWVKEGESELFVSLFNQRGTINLSKIFTTKDFESFRREPTPGLVLPFPSIAAEIGFLNSKDLDGFLSCPRRFFEAVSPRKAHDGELNIFKTVLASYEPQNGSHGGASGQPVNSDQIGGQFCYLGLFESTAKERWKATRRLVVSSWAKDPQPWCESHWLPFGDVQVRYDGDCGVSLRWSDCNQLDERRYGNHNNKYSLVYKRNHPNKKVYLRFKSRKETMKFVECIAYLNETPTAAFKLRKSITPSNIEKIRVYDVLDADKRDYRALVINRRSPEGYDVPSFYYTYRDIDFCMQLNSPETIQFNQMRYPHYISGTVDLPYEPDTEESSESVCAGVVECAEKVEVSAGHDENSVIEAITGWRLLFFRNVSTVILNEGKRFLPNVVKYQDVGVYLWEKASESEDETAVTVNLCLRLNNEKRDPWLTSPLTGDHRKIETGQIYVRLELELERGRTLDMTTMMASSVSAPAKKGSEKKLRGLRIIFEDKSTLEDFQIESKLFGDSRPLVPSRTRRTGTELSGRGIRRADTGGRFNR